MLTNSIHHDKLNNRQCPADSRRRTIFVLGRELFLVVYFNQEKLKYK